MLERAQGAAARIESGVAQLGVSTERQTESATEVRDSLVALTAQLERAEARSDELVGRVGSIVDGQATLVDGVQGGLAQAARASADLTGAAGVLTRSLTAHVDTSASLLEGLRDERAASEASRIALEATAGSFGEGARTFGTLLAELRGAAESLASAAVAIETRMTTAPSQLDGAAGDLAGQVERTGQVLRDTTGELAGQVERTGLGLRRTSEELASHVGAVADRLATTVDRLATELGRAGTGLGDGVRDFASETAAIRAAFERVVASLRELPVANGAVLEGVAVGCAAPDAAPSDERPPRQFWGKN